MSEQTDSRIVYCSGCTWWDDIYKIATIPFPGDAIQGRLPICPKCKAPLFEVGSIKKWNEWIESYVKRTGDIRYPAFVNWIRGKSFPDYGIARQIYERENPTE